MLDVSSLAEYVERGAATLPYRLLPLLPLVALLLALDVVDGGEKVDRKLLPLDVDVVVVVLVGGFVDALF